LAKRGKRTFSVFGKLTLDISVDIGAESLADAVDKAKALDVDDFVEILGSYNDGALVVEGVHANG
jgi:hypothetical protein